MINLDELLKELKSNKEIEFERLKKEFIKDDVIIEMGNCEKSFVEEWYIAMAGQKFAGQNWETGEDWKYTIEDFPQVAKVLAQNEHTNKDTIQYILFFAKGLEKDDNTKFLGYSIQDLVFAHPVFPEARYDIFEGGADFYESMAGSLAILPAMLKNPNYPSDALLMVMNEVEPVDSKTEAILNTVLKHDNFDFPPTKIENEISKSYSEQFYVDGQYKFSQNIYLHTQYMTTITKSSDEELDIYSKNGEAYKNAYRTYRISGIPKVYNAMEKEVMLDVLNNLEWNANIYHTEGDLEIESDVHQHIIKDMINDQDGDDYWDEGKTEVNFVGELDDLGYQEASKKDIFDPPQDHLGHPDIYNMEIIAIAAKLTSVDVYDAETDKEIFSWTYEDEKASNEDNLKETLKLVSEMK
jgi:hypothetical protein